jgi:predicted NAD/FAD-dependent oxidoreductase
MSVAVIGAGIAGLTAARMLQSAGVEVTVFDKSKGTGGRLSSRSHAGGWIDHGAPYLTGGSPGFYAFLRDHLGAGILQGWRASLSGVPGDAEQVDYIGVPRNSAVTRSLLGSLAFQPSTRIARLEAVEQGWQLYNDGESLLGTWQLVVIAVPAPQVLPLISQHRVWLELVRSVVMEPCWVAAIQTGKDLPGLADVSFFEHPVIHRVIRNSAKPGRQNEHVYLVQASASWSEEHLEMPPESVAVALLKHFNAMFPAAVESVPLFSHRWRYALTARALGQPFLWDEHLQLGICGDWCLGRSVEDAWQSGMELAGKIGHAAD